MFTKELLRQEIETALAAPASADALVAAKRKFGLRFILDARRGQTLADVAPFFHGISARFEVEPFYPTSLFPAPDPDQPSWRDTLFVANVYGVSVDDITTNPWDIAHAARAEGGFSQVAPEIPRVSPENPPEAEPDAAAAIPPEWVHNTMNVKQAWEIIERETGRKPGSNVEIGHPDTGWFDHQVWDGGNLNLKKSHNFMPGEREDNARDDLWGAQPGHGTSTASVMVAYRGGSLEGVAPSAVVVPIRCISNVFLQPGNREVALAIRYARSVGCRVISLSLGGIPLTLPAVALEVLEAVLQNVIVVAAAGQYLFPSYPTAEPAWLPYCIGVAGIEGTGPNSYKVWGHSHRNGPLSIKISAPAFPIRKASANPHHRNFYESSEGTSYATALTAGVAALWVSRFYHHGYPQLPRPAQYIFRDHLQRTMKPVEDPYFVGMVDAAALVSSLPAEAADGAEPLEADLSAVVSFARLAGREDVEACRILLAAALLGQDDEAEALEIWTREAVSIVDRDLQLRIEITERFAAGTLSADALRDLLRPAASLAMARQLAAAEPALVPV